MASFTVRQHLNPSQRSVLAGNHHALTDVDIVGFYLRREVISEQVVTPFPDKSTFQA